MFAPKYAKMLCFGFLQNFQGKPKYFQFRHVPTIFGDYLKDFLYICIGLKSSEISRFYAYFQKCSELAKSKHFIMIFLHVCTEIRKNNMFWVFAEFSGKTKML